MKDAAPLPSDLICPSEQIFNEGSVSEQILTALDSDGNDPTQVRAVVVRVLKEANAQGRAAIADALKAEPMAAHAATRSYTWLTDCLVRTVLTDPTSDIIVRAILNLANDLGCASIDWPTRQNHQCDVLINCTPVGMHPNLDESPFEEEWFDKRTLVFDTIYNPEQTLMIKQARAAECKTITGVDMFVLQAARQFKLFTGIQPDIKLIRYEVKRATSAARY